jgi:hypothetical protein
LGGSITREDKDEGVILTLKQTHVYPPKDLPLIKTNWIGTPGHEIALEYKVGPPASLSVASR